MQTPQTPAEWQYRAIYANSEHADLELSFPAAKHQHALPRPDPPWAALEESGAHCAKQDASGWPRCADADRQVGSLSL